MNNNEVKECEFYINKAKEVIKMIDVRLNPDSQANTSNFLDNISEAFLFNQSVDSLLDDALKQLLQLKAENEKLKDDIKTLERCLKSQDIVYNAACDKTKKYYIKVQSLTQKLEKVRKLEDIIYNIADEGQKIIKQHNDYDGRIYGLGYLQDIKDKIYYHQQALKELE